VRTALPPRIAGARLLGLTLTRVDAYEQRIEIGLARPSRDPDHIARLFGTKLDQVEPGFGIERMALVAERWDPLAPEALPSALAGRERAAAEAVLVDRLATRLGQRRLYRLGAVESDVPERCVRRLSPIETDAADWEPWPRPVRLLDPPECVEGVMALLPDGVPKRFTWRGKAYNIVRGDGPERIHGEWWRRAPSATASAIISRSRTRPAPASGSTAAATPSTSAPATSAGTFTACSRDRLSAARRSPECGRLFRNQASSRPTSGSEPQVRGPLL
jgi:hypothetical protein